MLNSFRFHHIGYVTNSIVDTSVIYVSAGYCMNHIIVDAIQQVKVCFLLKDNNPCIELIEPIDENSSVNKLLKKNGVFPYHLCYEVDNIDDAFNALLEMNYIPLFRPIEAVALDNKQICYLYKKEVGFIEIVNK
ncbi:methylmalonyl-CoA/ethylmalonyl-CoA epimerase [termite gut metagenome]|uniref:Methylmalonyl-CoA/ethylmalonyl-CoA epimerase n=1 Tax=termite gut metagenome TaxID=433724 RepID=A0A5J4QE21_9ZZZZ